MPITQELQKDISNLRTCAPSEVARAALAMEGEASPDPVDRLRRALGRTHVDTTDDWDSFAALPASEEIQTVAAYLGGSKVGAKVGA